MKKSKYIEGIVTALAEETKQWFDPPALLKVIRVAVALAEEAGAQWDPKEPEVEEVPRLTVVMEPIPSGQQVPVLVPEDRGSTLGMAIPLMIQQASEAAARSNAIPEILQWLEGWTSAHSRAKRLLAKEREKLAT